MVVVVQSGNREIFEPTIYRAVIDDVIAAIKPEFDEYGVSEDVLADLQHVSDSWSMIECLVDELTIRARRNGKAKSLHHTSLSLSHHLRRLLNIILFTRLIRCT